MFEAEQTPPSGTLTVTQLVDRIKNAIRVSVGYQWVEGEISNLRIQSSGHAYFSLKDAGAQIACVFFKQRAAGSRVALRDGLKVRAYGEATMYEQRGQTQLVLSKIEPAGQGDLQARFLELKAKLEREGLFDSSRKKQVPAFPSAIGLITSPTGAAIQDMRHILEERAPWVKVYLMPVLVQGDGAAGQIASAIRKWSAPEPNGLPRIDTLIIARGGGSIEDLWGFNEEIVARAIASCPIPLISGVGHEIDFTIADFVADLRAPTPSAAAMLATPDGKDLLAGIEARERTLIDRARQQLRHAALRLSFYERSDLGSRPLAFLEPFAQQLDDLEQTLHDSVSACLEDKAMILKDLSQEIRNRHPKLLNEKRKYLLAELETALFHSVHRKMAPLPQQLSFAERILSGKIGQRLEEASARIELLESRLDARNPLKTLDRGFALVRDQHGRIITSPDDTMPGAKIDITVKDGRISAITE